MHAFDAPSGAVYFHDGDFSGNVEVIARILETEDFDSDNARVEIPFADLKALVAKYVRMARISAAEDSNSDEVSRLEQMTDDEVLGVPLV